MKSLFAKSVLLFLVILQISSVVVIDDHHLEDVLGIPNASRRSPHMTAGQKIFIKIFRISVSPVFAMPISVLFLHHHLFPASGNQYAPLIFIRLLPFVAPIFTSLLQNAGPPLSIS